VQSRKPILYLAARYQLKEDIAEHAAELQSMGYRVTSTWMSEPHDGNISMKDVDEETLAEYAARDLLEIDEADLFVFFSEDPETPTKRGGRHVEFGYALAKGKEIVAIGPRENIFHYLEAIARFHSWRQFTEELYDCEFNVPSGE